MAQPHTESASGCHSVNTVKSHQHILVIMHHANIAHAQASCNAGQSGGTARAHEARCHPARSCHHREYHGTPFPPSKISSITAQALDTLDGAWPGSVTDHQPLPARSHAVYRRRRSHLVAHCLPSHSRPPSRYEYPVGAPSAQPLGSRHEWM